MKFLFCKTIFFGMIYKSICFFYRKVISNLQFLIFSNKKNTSSKNLDVFFYYKSQEQIDSILHNFNNQIIDKPYQQLLILSTESIQELIKIILNKELRKFITSKTGYKYSIDYFAFYKNFPLEKKDLNLSVYANKFHIDKPYSENMLKLIIPINVKTEKQGPLIIKKVLPLSEPTSNYNVNDFVKFLSSETGTNYYFFHPSRCFHKAEIPSTKNYCLQLMFQMNPSKRWKINKCLYQRQYKIEPKFPQIKSLFDRYNYF